MVSARQQTKNGVRTLRTAIQGINAVPGADTNILPTDH
jgi:hypothetical protein